MIQQMLPTVIEDTQGEFIWLWVNLIAGCAYFIIAYYILHWFKGRTLLGTQWVAYFGCIGIALNGVQRIVWSQHFNDFSGGTGLLVVDTLICLAAVITCLIFRTHNKTIVAVLDYISDVVKARNKTP